MKVTLRNFVLSLSTLIVLAAPLASVQRVLAAAGPNLISNASVESNDGTNPTDWLRGGWGTNASTLSYAGDAHSGSKSLRVDVSSYTNGDAKWYAKPVAVVAGKSYTFSDYYKSSVATTVTVQFKSTAGVYSYIDIAAAPAAADWQQVSGTFTTPSNVAEVTVFHLINKVGWLEMDDSYLGLTDDGTPVPAPTPTPVPTPAPTPANGNVISNPSVETVNATDATKPQGWSTSDWGNHTATFSYDTTGHTGSRSVTVNMSNYTDGAANWLPAAEAVAAGKVYEVQDWYKSTTNSEVDMAVTMSDGTTGYYYLGSATASTAWKEFVGQFTMPAGAVKATMLHMILSNGSLTTDDAAIEDYAPNGFNRAIVSLTFDDGWESIYANGLPLLKKYGLVSTQYIITGVVGSDSAYMTKAQVKAFYNAGNEIASHTVTHPHLPLLTQTQLTKELKNAQTTLQTWLGVPITDFASPYGEYNANVITNIQKYYASHRGVESGFNSKDGFDAYDIKVQNIDVTTTPAQVAAWVAQAQRDNTWLVLVYHDVDTSGDDYSVTPANLDTELSSIKKSGVAVETMNQALKEIQPQLNR